MLNCKKSPAPSSVGITTAVVSGIYTPVTTFGSILLILVILVDPCKQLRKRFNLWLIYTAAMGIVIGGIVDPYRSYGNYIKAMGENLDEIIPNRYILSKLCHVHLFCSMLLVPLHLFANLLEQHLNLASTAEVSPKKSRLIFGVVSVIILAISYAVSYQTVPEGFEKIEEIVYTITATGSLIGLALSVVHMLRLTDRYSNDDATNVSMTEKGEGAVNNLVKPVSNEDDSEADPSTSGDEIISHDISDKMQNAKGIMLSFAFLAVCVLPACVMIHLVMSDSLANCVQYHWFLHLRIILIISVVAWLPYLYMLTFPGMKRGVVALFKMIKRSQVEPVQEQ